MPKEEKSQEKKTEEEILESSVDGEEPSSDVEREEEPVSFEERWAMLVERKEGPVKKPRLELVLDSEKIQDLEKDIRKVSSQKKKNPGGDYNLVVKYEENKYNEVIGEYENPEKEVTPLRKDSKDDDRLNLVRNDNLRLQKKYDVKH